jgi:hypothetical protein
MARRLFSPSAHAAAPHVPWWINPLGCLCAWTVPLLLLAYLISPAAYLELWEVRKHVTAETVYQGGLLAASLAWGMLVGMGAVRLLPADGADGEPRLPERGYRLLMGLFKGGVGLSLVGYVAWLLAAASRGLTPALVIGVLTGEPGVADLIKQNHFQTVPGLTTLTQFAPASVLIGLLLLKRARWVIGPIALLIGLSIMRGLVLSERLAFLEIVIPTAVLALRLVPRHVFAGSPWRRALLAASPVAAVGGLMVFFTAFEYNRSWVAHYAHMGLSLWEFGSSRLTGYYVTSVNNSAMLLGAIAQPFPAPFFTMEWLWAFPGVSEIFPYEAVYGASPVRVYAHTLLHVGNPEFNNGGGLMIPIADFGLIGAAVYWAVLGAVVGACFVLYRRGRVAGLLLYPIMFQGLMELPRLLYCSSGRVFPTWVLLVAACVLLGARGSTPSHALRRPRAPRRQEVSS